MTSESSSNLNTEAEVLIEEALGPSQQESSIFASKRLTLHGAETQTQAACPAQAHSRLKTKNVGLHAAQQVGGAGDMWSGSGTIKQLS